MDYDVYLFAGDSVVYLKVHSEDAPKDDGALTLLGNSRFKKEQVLACVPDEASKGAKMLVSGRG